MSSRFFRMLTLVLVLIAGVTLAASLEIAKDKTLYQRLGGKKAIAAVVDEFVSRVAADNRINSFFQQTASNP
jgi:hemoglobin